MRICISERLRPFSHTPGISTILPGSEYLVQIFPCLIRIFQLCQSTPLFVTELSLHLKGPIQQFTVWNDLEKGRLTVSGKTTEGWICYDLIGSEQGKEIFIKVDRAPTSGFPFSQNGIHHCLSQKETITLVESNQKSALFSVPSCDRLSLGIHKKQDWDLIKRRFDLKEIFPLIHRLGQLIPIQPLPHKHQGTVELLNQCAMSFMNGKPELSEDYWKNFISASFYDLLVPRLEDRDYQGIISQIPLECKDTSPLFLLIEAAQLIRKIFIQQDKNSLFILPFLFPSFHCGRLLNISLEGGKLDMEWTKKTIRRLIFTSEYDQEWIFNFRHVKNYRLRKSSEEKGIRKNDKDTLFLEKNCHYLFDNFQ